MRDWLVKAGAVAADRIESVQGLGQLWEVGEAKEARAKNRRAVVDVFCARGQ
ncbi:MAG: hypothetical protein HY744_00190 [Deltaproteobacteria bacterium]|nr:hypothetical protein [Deltaproteobacteria bacterium]